MLKISAEDFRALRRHGEETHPNECCGVLLGHSTAEDNLVFATVPAGNTRTDSAHNRYHIAPQELIRIQRDARREQLDIVGFYHSHPDCPAQWSKTDFEEAHWIGCSYVITRVDGAPSDGRDYQATATVTNSFRLTGSTEDDKHFLDEEIAVVEQLAEVPHV